MSRSLPQDTYILMGERDIMKMNIHVKKIWFWIATNDVKKIKQDKGTVNGKVVGSLPDILVRTGFEKVVFE